MLIFINDLDSLQRLSMVMGEETNKRQVWGLLKFSKNRIHLQDLYENGRLYMNTVDYFKKLESGTGQSDELESATLVVELTNSTVKYEHPQHGSGILKIKSGALHNYMMGNIACFYGLYNEHFTNESGGLNIHEDVIKDFGEYVLFIHDIGTFFDRFTALMHKENYLYRRGRVDYGYKIMPYMEKELDFFSKQKKYSYQSEYRFYIDTGLDKEFILEMGSLKDIAWLLNADQLKQFKFKI